MPPPSQPPPSTPDAVVAVVDRDRLSGALVALHRAGFGPHVRVLDSARGNLAAQLRRAKLQTAIDPAALPSDGAVVIVNAPGRAAPVVDALLRSGARAVQALLRGEPAGPAAPAEPAQPPPPVAPDGQPVELP